MTKYIMMTAPEKYHAKLLPQFRMVTSYLIYILTPV